MGERSAIGLKFLDSSMGFPGLCRGITRSTFQMFRIFALFTKSFMVSVRYLSCMGPRCVSGLALFYLGLAPYFSFSLIASINVLHLNILPSISSFLIVLRVYLFCSSFFLGCGVYCLLNLLAHFVGSWQRVIFLASKYMALFAGGLSLLDKSAFTVLQSLQQLPL